MTSINLDDVHQLLDKGYLDNTHVRVLADYVPGLVADLATAHAQSAMLASMLAEFVTDADSDPCWFDHHGYCQAHSWFESNQACYMARARAMLEQMEARSAARSVLAAGDEHA